MTHYKFVEICYLTANLQKHHKLNSREKILCGVHTYIFGTTPTDAWKLKFKSCYQLLLITLKNWTLMYVTNCTNNISTRNKH